LYDVIKILILRQSPIAIAYSMNGEWRLFFFYISLNQSIMKRFLSPAIIISFCVTFSATAQSVDLITGRLQYSVPVGGIQANDISIPISIAHHGGALQVPEGDGSCGLGWNLSVGGAVTRMVRGLPDEINTATRKGWLVNGNAQAIQNFVPQANDDLSDCTDEESDYNVIDGLVGEMINDTEPDVFYISAPGVSVQFIFGTDGLPKLLVHQDVKIEYVSGNFTVRSNGYVYSFNDQEVITRTSKVGFSSLQINTDCGYYSTTVSFTRRWNLTSITSSASGTTANLYYATLPQSKSRTYLSIDSINYIEETFIPIRISSILLKSFTAQFTWLNDLLTKISLTESNTSDKLEFQLLYSTVSSSENYPLVPVSRSLLTGLVLSNNSPYAMYQFEYNYPPTSVWRRNWSMDHFGYYNGVASNNNNPYLYFYSSEIDGRRLRSHPIPGGNPTLLPGTNRSVDTTYTAAGALKKIKLPTGGVIDIVYESNRYIDNSTSQELKGGGVRVKKIISQGGEIAFGKSMEAVNPYRAIVREYEYRLSNGSSSGMLMAPVKLGYITANGIKKSVYNMGDDADVLYTRVKEKITGQGSRITEFSIPGVFPETINGAWKATKSRIARKKQAGQCPDAGDIKNGFYTFPYPPSTNYNHKRGSVTRLSVYSEAGVLIREELDSMQDISSNPVTVKGLKFERIGGIYHYGVYEMLTGRTQVIRKQILREASEINPNQWLQTITEYFYNSNNMLESVTTTLPDNSVTQKKFKYAKDFQFSNPVATDMMAVALKKLNDTNRYGEIVEQISKVTLPGVSEAVSSSLILYRDFGNNRILPYYFKTLPPGAALTEAGVSNQNFISDSDYLTVKTLKEYDTESRLLTTFDDKRNYAAYHYSVGTSTKVVTLVNAKAQQAIYEGFEMTTSFGLSASGTGVTYQATSWTGAKAIQFTNSTAKLISSGTNLIQKAGNDYRISCWVYSVSGKTITISAKLGGTTVSVVLTNPQNNAWNYLEKNINVATITGPFSLEVSTNATSTQPVIIDDFVFIPKSARIAFQTVLPLTGITSETDDRGNSVKYIYDDAKRLSATLDRNRNLVNKTEYVTKVIPPTCLLTANFARPAEVIAGVQASFAAGQSCGSAITYTWEVDGVTQTGAITNTLNYTFISPGSHNVRLTVSDPVAGSQTFMETICVKLGELSITILDAQNNPVNPNTVVFDCNSTNMPLSFSLNGLGSFASNCTVTWYKLVYNSTYNEYQMSEIDPGAVLVGSTTTYVAVVRSDNGDMVCFGNEVQKSVTLNYNSNVNCN
jgi:YD repeat-containing protein